MADLIERAAAVPATYGGALFAAAPAPMLVVAPDASRFTIVDVNEAYLTATMRSREGLLGRALFEAMPDNPDDASATGVVNLRASIERAIANRRPDRMPVQKYDIPHPGGGFEERWWEPVNAPVLDQAGEVLAIVHQVTDVTRRIGAEVRARADEARYRALFDLIDEGFCVLEFIDGPLGLLSDYVHVEANPAYTANAGIPDIVGKRLREVVLDQEADSWIARFRSVLVSGEPIRFDQELAATGRHLELAAFPVGSAEQRQVAVLFQDVTARKRAEAALRELNETLEAQVAERTTELQFYRDIIEANVSPICAFDADYRLIAFNQAHADEFFRIFGHRVQLGEIFPDLFPPDQAPVMRAFMARALAGEHFTVVEEFGDPNLAKPYWEVHYTPLRDAQGQIVGAFHLATDITARLRAGAELKTAQDALRQSQKMEAMGQLTGGVAHDFNNLLTPIIGSLDMLQRRGLGNEREQRLIGGAMKSAERAKTLVQRLLAFARRQPLQATAVDLSSLIAGMAGLLGSTLGPKVEIRIDLDADLPPVSADSNQLEMALLNLAVNARDAMEGGGVLTIAAKRDHVQGAAPSDLAVGHYVRLSVSDAGAGMDEATLARAVEPFFSTKGIGKGTGLGLSMVHGLAAQLGGKLTIESRPGAGTTVELWLPVSTHVSSEEQVAPKPSAVVSRGRALLVDDEELVRMSTADMLADLGYEVVEASSAEEALQLIHSGVEPDILVTDHLMPGMSGAELARTVKALEPTLPVLLVSGYAEAGGVAPDLPRLIKPFRNAELAERLVSLMIDTKRAAE